MGARAILFCNIPESESPLSIRHRRYASRRDRSLPSDDLLQEVLRNGAAAAGSAELPAHGGVRRDAPRDEESTNYHRKIYVFFFQMLKNVLQKMRNFKDLSES